MKFIFSLCTHKVQQKISLKKKKISFSVWFYKLICIVWLTFLCMSLKKGKGKVMSHVFLPSYFEI